MREPEHFWRDIILAGLALTDGPDAVTVYLTTPFPVDGDEITCGSRTWLFRKQRVHQWVPLGRDYMNKGILGIVEVDVDACRRCGKDRRALFQEND